MSYLLRTTLEDQEDQRLAPYAQRSRNSRGREVSERLDRLRTEFQRDRDRILHCSAFRKLEYKTQVYVTHEGDYFRTRLTHTLEVAQIARTVARSLALNQDLVEAIALAHDLGHTPFGHIGETVLDELLAAEGGFEHNAQSLRVVELLEDRFVDRPGLNLTWEVRAGIAQHSHATDRPEVSRYLRGQLPSLEAQVVDVADEIAYNHHDLDDALAMGLLQVEQFDAMPWLAALWQRAEAGGGQRDHIKFRALGAMMDHLVHNLLEHTSHELMRRHIDSPEAAITASTWAVGFSPEVKHEQTALRDFLMSHVYRHPITLRMQSKAARFLKSLFQLYREEPELLPLPLQQRAEQWGLPRVITDYLSGMTDRHCLEEYLAHFEPTLRWSK
jgi:dGTPase